MIPKQQKIKPPSKEDLQRELSKVSLELTEYRNYDEKRREVLSKLFGSYKSSPYLGSREEVNILNWYEIFIEIGKLKSQQDYLDLAHKCENNYSSIQDIGCEIAKLKEK